jgi:ABC-type branched-subunit amino acid transport system permease subunit
MITLALAQMIYFFCLQAPFTHGEDGIQSVPRGKLFGLLDLSNTLTMYYVVLFIFMAAFALIYRVIHSPFGQVLKAIRENEPRAISLGYDARDTSSSPSCFRRRWRASRVRPRRSFFHWHRSPMCTGPCPEKWSS